MNPEKMQPCAKYSDSRSPERLPARLVKGNYRCHKASIKYIDLPEGSYNGNYPPENVLELGCSL